MEADEEVKLGVEDHLLHKHDLQQTQARLLLRHLGDIPQETGEEQPIHLVVHIVRIRVGPDEHGGVLLGVGRGPEPMRHPWRNVVRSGFGCVLGRMDGVDLGIQGCGANFTGEDEEGLGLLEV
jgi:hypothetical protein